MSDISQNTTANSTSFLSKKAKDYFMMMKPNLSFMIAFSSIIGYLMAPGITFDWQHVLELFIGGMLVTNGSNVINQIIERFSDREMKRTKTRPLPAGRMGVKEAWIATLISSILGVVILTYFFNPLTGFLSFLALLLYGFAYTPMKKIHPIATFVGALPGALPPLIGWAAATGSIFTEADALGWVLFFVQFFWQFPHFWAIAWLGYEEYLKAGIAMLPSKAGKTSFTGLQCIFYSLPLIPLGMLPYFMNVVGNTGTYFAVGIGVYFTAMAVQFYIKSDNLSAKQLLYSSFLYLPVVLLAFAIDKI